MPVPAGAVLGRLDVQRFDRPLLMAASLYTALTEESIAAWGGWPQTEDWPVWADAIEDAYHVDRLAVHYTDPLQGLARIEPVDNGALGGVYRYVTSGTSSEAGYSTAMSELLIREGFTPDAVSIGFCQPDKSVDAECLQRLVDEATRSDPVSLYARSYDVSRAKIAAALGESVLQPQLYDRHWDATQDDGIDALDDIYSRMFGSLMNAATMDIAWIPQHINFAKYKVATGGGDLLSDGVHATAAVQAGLAAMSYVSRTGRSPSTTGVSTEAAVAIEIGEHTIRTLATMSRTGLHIPDLPRNRVQVH